MLERLPRVWRNAALCALGLLVLWFAWGIRSVINPLLIGYLAAYILHPVVLRVRGTRLSHRAAVNLVFAAGAGLMLLLGLATALQARALVRDVVTDEALREEVAQALSTGRTFLVERVGLDLPSGSLTGVFDEVRERLRELWEANEAAAGKAAQAVPAATLGVWHVLQRLFGWVAGVGGMLVLVPLYAYYLLFELERLHGFVRRYLPARERARLGRVGASIGEVLANFFRGRLFVCFAKGMALALGLWVAGVPHALLLGALGGALSLVPAFGPLASFVLALLVGCLEHSLLGSLVRTGVVFALAELLEGYVLIPKVLGDSLGLHPLVVIFSLLAGGAALGLFGVLVALPLTASLVIVVRELVLPALERFADEDGDSPILQPRGPSPPGRP